MRERATRDTIRGAPDQAFRSTESCLSLQLAYRGRIRGIQDGVPRMTLATMPNPFYETLDDTSAASVFALRVYSDQEMILHSAQLLGIECEGKNVLYDFESDMTVHFGFLLYEYRWNGQTAVEHYYTQERWETDTERTILEAVLDAETSLFKITAINEADNRLVLTDLLGDTDDISVMDINLSHTAESGVLLFFRLVPYEEFNMTSGVAFPFPADEQDRLLSDYEHQVDHLDSQPPSVQRFVAFYDLYCDYGSHIQYE